MKTNNEHLEDISRRIGKLPAQIAENIYDINNNINQVPTQIADNLKGEFAKNNRSIAKVTENLEGEFAKTNQKIANVEQNIGKLNNDLYKDCVSEVSSKMEQSIDIVTSEYMKIVKDTVVIGLKGEISKLNEKLKTSENNIKSLKSTICKKDSEIAQKDNDIKNEKEQNKKLKIEIENLKNTDKAQQQIKKLENELKSAKKLVEQVEEAVCGVIDEAENGVSKYNSMGYRAGWGECHSAPSWEVEQTKSTLSKIACKSRQMLSLFNKKL